MYAVESMIERCQEQIKLAPSLTQNEEPGGSLKQLLERLTEGEMHKNRIDVLRGVESGPRRYGECLEKARQKLEPLAPLWAEIENAHYAKYNDGEGRQKALGRLRERVPVIVKAYEGAVADLKAAKAILEEGENRAVRK